MPVGDDEYPTDPDAISRAEAVAAIDYDLEHPRVYHTPAGIEQARRNAQTTEWGQRLRQQIVEIADALPRVWDLDLPAPPDGIQEQWIADPPLPADAEPFVGMDPETIRAIAPQQAPDGETYFASPFPGGRVSVSNRNVCPICAAELEVASFERPGHVTCRSGHEFPGEHDDIVVEDSGDGWTTPADVPDSWAAEPETTFWLVARYNAYISKAMCDAVELLGYAHVLTASDPDRPTRYAETAAILLDVLAQACVTSHGTIVDQGGASRLHRPGYSAPKPVRRCINGADLVWSSGVLDAPSPATGAGTIVENVAENLVVEIADFAWRNQFDPYDRLYHTTNYNMGMLAASSLLGLDVGYAAWTLDGHISLEKFLENYVMRDGATFLPSGLYGYTFHEYARLAAHIETDRYPEGRSVYDHPRFVARNVEVPAKLAVAGRRPRYGDGPSDLAVTSGPDYGSFHEILHVYAQAATPDDQQRIGRHLRRASGMTDERDVGSLADRLCDIELSYWNVGVSISTIDHARALFTLDGTPDLPTPAGESQDVTDATQRVSADDSALLPVRRAATVRPASGTDRGAMVHFSPALTHGHHDCLGLHVYGAGRELSWDPGHLPTRHFRRSFLHQTVAHNTCVVNETSQGPPTDPGGSLRWFADRDGYTSLEAVNPAAYAHEGVEQYRRTVVWLDAPGADGFDREESYLVDVFRVAGEGVETVDYAFHGQGVDFTTDLDLSGPRSGSVASPDYTYHDKVRPSGEIEGFEDEDWQFVAPPGNGYGLLGNPRSAPGTDQWSATWRTIDQQGPASTLQLTMLGNEDRGVTVADGPDGLARLLDLDPDAHAVPYVLARESSPAQFVSVIEPGPDDLPVEAVREISASGGDRFDPVALAITLGDGVMDYVLSSPEPGTIAATDDSIELVTDAACAHVRTQNDEIERVHVERGSELSVTTGSDHVTLTEETASIEGTVTDVDHDDPALSVDVSVPSGDAVAGTYALVDAPEYTRNAPFEIERVEPTAAGSRLALSDPDTLVAANRVRTRDGDVIEAEANFPTAWTRNYYVDGEAGNTFLDGRRIVAESGAEARVEAALPVDGVPRQLRLSDAGGFQPGDAFRIYDVKSGDTVRVPRSICGVVEDGRLAIESIGEVDVAFR